MINHVRTLLLNRNGSTVGLGNFAHEYVPPSFTAVRLPGTLNRLARAIFGSAPDIAGMNYRLRQLVPFLHAAEVRAYTLMDDDRITYPLTGEVIFRETNQPQFINVHTGIQLSFVFEPGAMETDSGKLEYLCRCIGAVDSTYGDTGDPSNLFVTPPAGAPVLGLNGLSDPLLLPNSNGLSIRLSGGTLAEDESFMVYAMRKPKTSIADLPSRIEQVLNEEVALALFGAGSPDRFKQFSDWWYHSDQLHFRLAGVLLALAHRTDLIRNQGN